MIQVARQVKVVYALWGSTAQGELLCHRTVEQDLTQMLLDFQRACSVRPVTIVWKVTDVIYVVGWIFNAQPKVSIVITSTIFCRSGNVLGHPVSTR